MSANSFVILQNQKCPNCGANIPVKGEILKTKCDYCDTEFRLIRPITVSHELNKPGSDGDKDRYSNLITILEKSMLAGNYKEAYDYANKALEINPSDSSLWENKAICSFWLSTKQDIVQEQAKQTLTYLRTAHDYNPDSSTLPITSEMISWNLFILSLIWLKETKPDVSQCYSLPLYKQYMLTFVGLWEVCFEIYPNTVYLKEAVKELSGQGKLKLPPLEKNPMDTKMREVLIRRILDKEPDYQPPEIKSCFIATAALGDPDHPDCVRLRQLRDEVLVRYSAGVWLITFYYRHSPVAAQVIAPSILLRAIARNLVVKPLVMVSHFLLKWNEQHRQSV